MNSLRIRALLLAGVFTGILGILTNAAEAQSYTRSSIVTTPPTYSTIQNLNGDNNTLNMTIGAPKSYIGKDSEGDFIMQVTPPPTPLYQQQTPMIIVPEVTLPQQPVIQPRTMPVPQE